MQFFRVEGFCRDQSWMEENSDRRTLKERALLLGRNAYDYNMKLEKSKYIFVEDISNNPICLGVITSEPMDVSREAGLFTTSLCVDLEDEIIDEITFDRLQNMLRNAKRNGLVTDDDSVLHRFGLDRIDWRISQIFDYLEGIISPEDRKSIYAKADRLLVRKNLTGELDRIYARSKKVTVLGHPVHYLLMTDDEDTREKTIDILLTALYGNGRIRNRRFCTLTIDSLENNSVNALDGLYKSNVGGTAVLDFTLGDEYEDDKASVNRETVENVSRVIKKYRNQVLTVLCLGRECTKNKEMFYESLPGLSLIEISEDLAYGREAEDYLRILAADAHLRTNRKLFAAIEPGEGYRSDELQGIFDSWYENQLKNNFYPAYRDIHSVRTELMDKSPKGSAYQQLMEMTGLTEAKRVILESIEYYKAQKIFADKGMKQGRVSMHMIFTGNPGTAKTTCARLFAEIMKENGILSRGDLIEVGRGDLVGKYVGWTAPLIKKWFNRAEGSVLFIDEAYALVDDRDGSYGDEAINAIVQEMENHRENVVVIFAGYPDKMEGFLNKNPGLRSRIAFSVPFPDYSTQELCEISGLIARDMGFRLTEEALDKLGRIFDLAKEEDDFGNGRYARNLIEKAKMAQAGRLIRMDYEDVRKEDIETILPEDLEMPVCRREKVRIGFCA